MKIYPRILGWTVCLSGEVIAVGSDCTLFKKGDAVDDASISRQGTNCEFHLVDEPIVGGKPKSLRLRRSCCYAAYNYNSLGGSVR